MIDAHHHVWCPESRNPDVGYGWLRDIGAPKPFGDPTPIQRDYLWPEFLAEPSEPLAGSVHLQADNSVDPLVESDWAARTARAAGHDVAIVGLVDLSAPDAADAIAAQAAIPEFRGVRQIVARDPDRPALTFAPKDWLTDPDWRRGLAILAETGLSFDLQLYAHQTADALDALAPHPRLDVIVDHALSPVDGPTEAWREAVSAVALREATSIKLSGWGMFDADWSADTIGPMVAHILGAFGSDRVMFGSNYPVEKLARSYDDTVSEVRRAVTSAGGAPDAIFAGTARRVYRL